MILKFVSHYSSIQNTILIISIRDKKEKEKLKFVYNYKIQYKKD